MFSYLIEKIKALFKKPQEEVTFEVETWPFPAPVKKKRPQVKKATTRKPATKKPTVKKTATKTTTKKKVK